MADLSKADQERMATMEKTLAEAHGAIKLAKFFWGFLSALLIVGLLAIFNLSFSVSALQEARKEAKDHPPWAADIAEIRATLVGIKERLAHLEQRAFMKMVKAENLHSHDGRIEKISKKNLVLNSQEGETKLQFTFSISPKVEVTLQGKPLPFEQLKVGDRVRIWHSIGGGPLEAIEKDPSPLAPPQNP